ncbi:HlyD family type I secretion periplasmic adaptor subunit [Dulcicalothrix desertica PCC 7102]|uniref:HlyD family type I secretion periplasmic adaptor subunit n=1 Tax=Dulcicalothrix desertica PCC 7102 TaxID=232991 RepID=A0A3S1C6K5_9CYAN|nr:HlyD family efflux transporter periplasmic adaptor subunit [Dulcicalothrix desertica]RUS96247.1 HlyD family type I secretion periplasmic adaptor subunit [Dulcicalothrix desertica PCC 7102]TWH40428.1 HlyD family secretion protein [Dulcicalothrix desertica PCC 7102]
MPYPSNYSSNARVEPEIDAVEITVETTDIDNNNGWSCGTEELLDALPQPWTRSLLYVLLICVTFVLPWAMLSKVDETGSARGRIEPEGATQRLDSQASGSVKAVKVKKGDVIKANQVLVELESDVLQAQIQQVQTKLEGIVNQRRQLELLATQLQSAIDVTEQQNKSQELEKLAQVNQAYKDLDTKQSTHNLQKLEKLAPIEQAQQNIESTQTALSLADIRLSKDIAEVQRYKELAQQGVVPQTKIVELEKQAQESQVLTSKAQSDVKQAHLRLKQEQSRYQVIINQTLSDIGQAKLRYLEQQSSYKSVIQAGRLALLKSQENLKDLQTQIGALQSQIAQTRAEITSLKLQLQQKIVRAPIDGVIFALPIEKPGMVVQPGQMIAQIAPKNTTLILKAQIPSQQSGFLKVGRKVKVKFDAYPYQDYGVAPGQIKWISPDSKVNQTPQGNIETFELDIALQQPYLESGNKRITLTPGQTATAEVIIRQRRVIDFMLDPFRKLQKGGLEL